jgi:hypothetical protein
MTAPLEVHVYTVSATNATKNPDPESLVFLGKKAYSPECEGVPFPKASQVV